MSLMPQFERDLERVADGWHRPAARLRRAARPIALTLVVGALAASAGLLAVGARDPGEREVGPARTVEAQPGEMLSANFSVFRSPGHDTEARRVGPTTYAEVTAVPRADSLCMLVDEGRTGSGTSCRPLAQVFDRGMHTSSAAPGPGSERVVYGIVPDWVTEVGAIAPDGTVVSAVPVRNGYQLEAPARTSRGMLARADGSTVPFQIPRP